MRLAPQMCRANLAARRGRPDVAAEVFSQAIGQAASDPVVEAHMRLLASVELAGHPAVHAQALDHVDRVLAAMARALSHTTEHGRDSPRTPRLRNCVPGYHRHRALA